MTRRVGDGDNVDPAIHGKDFNVRENRSKRGEEPPPSPPAVDVPGDIAAEAKKIRAELYRRAERIEDAERQQLCRDLDGWAATLHALADDLVTPHAHQDDAEATPVTPISAAPSHREPMNLGLFSDAGGEEFVHPDSREWTESEEARLARRDPHQQPSPWRIE